MELKRYDYKIDGLDDYQRWLLLFQDGNEFQISNNRLYPTDGTEQGHILKILTNRAEAERQFDLLVEWLKL